MFNVFLRKRRIKQLNFCFFYEQQPFMNDPVTYVLLALPRAIIGQMALGFTEHESEAA